MDLIGRHQTALRAIGLGAFVLGALLAWLALPLDEHARRFVDAVDDLGARGIAAFAGVYVVSVLLLVPGSALTLAGGAVFGPLAGTAIVSVASTIAAALAFLLARTVARDAVERAARDDPRLAALEQAVGEGGWRVVALLRLAPVVPYSVINYALGVTPVRLAPYVIATWVAMLPGTFVNVYLGHIGRTGLIDARSPLEWALLGAGGAAGLAIVWVLGRRARRALEAAAPEGGALAPAPGRTIVLLAAGLLVLAAGAAAWLGAFDRLLEA
ncbi:MAG: VTT domain-containing protein [Planctomycetes bacterium]|nr:VTT domain-containing protein [Planctomycetota bacterium]